jgi:AraC-like DNA-binding protein
VAHGVLLYLYVRAFTDPSFTLRKVHLWHAVPILVLMVSKLLLNYVFGVLDCYAEGACSADDDNMYVKATFIYKYLVLGTYIFFTWREAEDYRRRSNTPRDQFRYSWVRQIVLGVTFLFAGILLLQVGRAIFPDLFWERMLLGNILTTFFIFIFLYLGNSYTYIFVSPSKKRFVNLSESFDPNNCRIEDIRKERESVFERLETLMCAEEPFRKGHLTLNELAEKLGTSPPQLSQSIHQQTGKNFNDYINTFRVQKLKKLMEDPANRRYKIMSLAHDCGFTSKSSLIRIFKVHTGQTPSQYLESVGDAT